MDIDTVPAQPFDVLKSARQPRPLVDQLRVFEQRHGTWIAEQNARSINAVCGVMACGSGDPSGPPSGILPPSKAS